MSTLLQGFATFLRAVIPVAWGLNPVAATALGALFFVCAAAGLYQGTTTLSERFGAYRDRLDGPLPGQNIQNLGPAPAAPAKPAYSNAPLENDVNANLNVLPGPFKLVAVEVTKTYQDGRQEKESYTGSQSSFTLNVTDPWYESQSTLQVTVPAEVFDDNTPITLGARGQANWNLKSGPSRSTNMNLGVGIVLYGEQKNINGDGARALGPGSESLSATAEAVTSFGQEAYVGKFKVDGVPHRKIGARLFTAVVQSSAGIEVSYIYREVK